MLHQAKNGLEFSPPRCCRSESDSISGDPRVSGRRSAKNAPNRAQDPMRSIGKASKVTSGRYRATYD